MTTITRPSNLIYDNTVDFEYEGADACAPATGLDEEDYDTELPFNVGVVGKTQERQLLI